MVLSNKLKQLIGKRILITCVIDLVLLCGKLFKLLLAGDCRDLLNSRRETFGLYSKLIIIFSAFTSQ